VTWGFETLLNTIGLFSLSLFMYSVNIIQKKVTEQSK
jgi:hypothetical protein